MNRPNCGGEKGCALDKLAEVFPLEECGNVAMAWTCFPFDCNVAYEQAQVIVDKIKGGMSKDAVFAEIDASVTAAMAAAGGGK